MARMLGDIKFHEHQSIDASVTDRWQSTGDEVRLSTMTWRLAELLGYKRPSAPGEGTIRPVDRDKGAEELLGRLDQLSPDEVRELLDSMGPEKDS